MVTALQVSWLNFGPRFRWDGNRLTARTSIFLQLLSLLSYCRKVVVDRGAGHVIIRNRYLWVLRSFARIRFDEVDSVYYRYAGVPSLEMYVVSLGLKGGRPPVNLFTFWGTAPDPSEILPLDLDLLSLRGDQAAQSLTYVELLTSYLNVPLGPRLGRRGRDYAI